MEKSATSVQIGAISIDLNLPMPGNCEHFTIRGYTAEMRSKDKKICSPFGSSNMPEEQLPPLDVPKFKRWWCYNCMREVGADESAGDEIGDASVHTGSTTAAAHILTNMKYVSEPQNGEGSNAIMDGSVDTSDDEFISSWKRNKPICNVVGNKTVKAGDGTGSEGVRIEEIGNPATEVIVSKQYSAREIEPNSTVLLVLETVANPLDSSTKIAVTEPIPSNDGNDKVVPHDGRDGEIDPEKEKGSRNGQRTVSNTSGQMELLGSKEKVLNTSNVKLRGLPSLGSRKDTITSKGSDANLAENNQCDLHEDSRKTPKVRLMTDLLGGKVNLETRRANAEQISANNMLMVSSEPDTVAAPKDKVAVLEDVGKGIKISQKKRNMSQEDGSKSWMNLDGKMAKRLKALNQNQKASRSPMDIEVTDSRPGENGSDREQRLQSGSKSAKIKHRSDKDSGVSRKKHNQAQAVGGYSLQMPSEGKNIGIGTNAYGANILFQSPHASTSTGKVECRLRNNNESLHGKEKDSGLSWNSNKSLEVRHTSSHMNVAPDKNLPRESLSKAKDFVRMPIGMGMVNSQPVRELSIKEKLDRSLSGFRSAQRRVENDTIQSKSTTNWPLIPQKGNKSCDPLIKQSNVFESGQSSRKGVNSLVRQQNVLESGQSLRKEVTSLVRHPINVSEPGQPSSKDVNSLVRQSNLSRSGQSSREGVKSLFRRPHVSETGQSSSKRVNPLVRQTNVPETGQSSRKGVILDLNQGISQTPPMWQEIQSSPNLLQRGNLQIQKPMEMPRPRSKANLNEVQGPSNVVKPQKDKYLKKVMVKGPSEYVPPMDIVEMSATNQYERSLPQTQSNLTIERNGSGVIWLNPGSTSFYPVHANINADVGALRGNILQLPNVKANSTEMAQVQEMQFKLFGASTQIQQRPSNRVQVSAPVPTRWGLQHGEGPKPVWFPAAQNISFGHGNPQKGKTISDIKTVDPKSSKKPGHHGCSSKGLGFSNFKERPFSPCNNHPSIHMDGHQNILFNGSFLSHNHSSGVHMGGYAAGQSSRQPVPYFHDQVSLQPQVQEKKRKSHAPSRLDGTRLQQSSGLLRTARDPESRGLIGASCSKVVLLQDDNASKSCWGYSTPAAVLPVGSILEKDPPCIFNENPADIAEADDEKHMRTVEDQKRRDKSVLRENAGGAHLDGRKRPRRKERPGRMPLGCRAS
ncbi:hypothetical protein RND71_016269 [Anisodus tanguticus]|uniref:Uncharacterized protein n=1 Tax=Anisodus tanguticus TaxID=243964 RepID=A0AAE1S9I8_9SOLA|nr:hypothetical protein RND71_016269 [Anisodus tanguticus]